MLKICLVFLSAAILAVLAYLLKPSIVNVLRGEEKPQEVQWVNPELPKMEGLTHHVLASQAMGHEVGYVVWTPPSYPQDTSGQFPVIYYLHGKNGHESSDAAGFATLVDSAIREGKMPPVILVFPNGGLSDYQEPVKTMILDELIPLISTRYRTEGKATGRAIVGFSMGGAAAVRLSLMHPELFGAAVSWGGGMWPGDKALLGAAEQGADILKSNNFGMLLINGDKDRAGVFDTLTEKLANLGIKHEVIVLTNQKHHLQRYYNRSGDAVAAFLARHLQN